MPRTIISDTSCLIILAKVDELELLNKLYGEILTTQTIAEEFGQVLPTWIRVSEPKDKMRQKLLETQIDEGEASAISLAMEYKDCTLILDDLKARKIAHQLGINFTGTLGVIIKAKLNGITPSIKPILEKIKRTNFRLTSEIETKALIEARELI